ncbi:unnamed protein product, partial [Closterium sp. Naga37s-1]
RGSPQCGHRVWRRQKHVSPSRPPLLSPPYHPSVALPNVDTVRGAPQCGHGVWGSLPLPARPAHSVEDPLHGPGALLQLLFFLRFPSPSSPLFPPHPFRPSPTNGVLLLLRMVVQIFPHLFPTLLSFPTIPSLPLPFHLPTTVTHQRCTPADASGRVCKRHQRHSYSARPSPIRPSPIRPSPIRPSPAPTSPRPSSPRASSPRAGPPRAGHPHVCFPRAGSLRAGPPPGGAPQERPHNGVVLAAVERNERGGAEGVDEGERAV